MFGRGKRAAAAAAPHIFHVISGGLKYPSSTVAAFSLRFQEVLSCLQGRSSVVYRKCFIAETPKDASSRIGTMISCSMFT